MKIKERIKSFLLAFLVFTTIYLVQQLWVEFPDELLSSLAFGQETDYVEESVISDFIQPEKYIIGFGGNNRGIMYYDEDHDLWNKGKEILKTVFQSKSLKIEEMTNEEIEESRKKRFIGYYFSNDIYTFVFSKIFDADASSPINESIKKVNSIYMYMDSLRDSFIVISDGNSFIKISGDKFRFEVIKSDIDIISKGVFTRAYTVTDLIDPDIKNDTYIPLEVKFNSPQIHVQEEIDVSNELVEKSIASLFFNRDLAYIRRIEESDGSIIYIDSQKTLKIHENGTLEFFKSVDANPEAGNLIMSLNNAIDFVDTHMGWPKDAYLYKVDEIEFENNKGFRFTFRYKLKGLPVISGEQAAKNSIELELVNNLVKSYRRHILEEFGSVTPKYKNMLSAYDVINENYGDLKAKYIKNNNINVDTILTEELDIQFKSVIENASLAIFDSSVEGSQYLKPVWIIDVAGYSYIFDAYDGYGENGGNPR
ncbi:MAG: hypothetical protein WDA24_01425 [Tissierellales bacterium]